MELTSQQSIPTMETLESDGKTAMLAAINGKYAGLVAVADTIKETSAEAIHRLQAMGIQVIMMTGDNRAYSTSHRERSRR